MFMDVMDWLPTSQTSLGLWTLPVPAELPILPDLLHFLGLSDFSISPLTLTGAALWALALYLGGTQTADWIALQLQRWLNFAERSLYSSQAEFDRTKRMRDSLNAFYGSLFSTVPFLILGGICNYGIEYWFGTEWVIAFGTLACVSGATYELGRRSDQESS
jgi:hypothetical protein